MDLPSAAGKHCGRDIANLFFASLKKYDLIKKIQGITLDNTNVNEKFIVELSEILKIHNVSFDIENGHFKCLAHIINLGVQDFLQMVGKIPDDESYEDENDEEFHDHEDLENIVYRIRTLCKKNSKV